MHRFFDTSSFVLCRFILFLSELHGLYAVFQFVANNIMSVAALTSFVQALLTYAAVRHAAA
jgi:hypothetical protein